MSILTERPISVVRVGEIRLATDKINEFPDAEIESQLTLGSNGLEWQKVGDILDHGIKKLSKPISYLPEIRIIPPKVKFFYRDNRDNSHSFRINFSPTEGTTKYVEKWKTEPETDQDVSTAMSQWGIKVRTEAKSNPEASNRSTLPVDLINFRQVLAIYQLRKKWVVTSPSGRYYNIALGGNWNIDEKDQWKDTVFRPTGEPKMKLEVEYKGRSPERTSARSLEEIVHEIREINIALSEIVTGQGMTYPVLKTEKSSEG